MPTSKVPNVETFYDPDDLENNVKVWSLCIFIGFRMNSGTFFPVLTYKATDVPQELFWPKVTGAPKLEWNAFWVTVSRK